MTRLLLVLAARRRLGWPCGSAAAREGQPRGRPVRRGGGARVRARHGPRRRRRDGRDRGGTTRRTGPTSWWPPTRSCNRVIESGATSPDLDIDVAKIPWVLARSADSSVVEVAALGQADGAVCACWAASSAREALRVLAEAGLGAEAARSACASARGRCGWRQGELAIVPLSLAGVAPGVEPGRPAAHGPRARRARELAPGRRARVPRLPARASRATRRSAPAAGPPPDEARAAALPARASRPLDQPPRRELRLGSIAVPVAVSVALRVPHGVADAGQLHRHRPRPTRAR